MKFNLFVFISCSLLGEFAQCLFFFSGCLPDTPQKCDRDSPSLNWPETKMRFLLYTRKTRDDPERLHMCNGTLPKNSLFNPKNPLIVIIPGFMFGTCELESIPEIKDELLKKGDMNVILMINSEDYGNDFLTALENVEREAKIIVQVLQNIQDKTGIKNKNVYLIGHSLGAHVAGLVGKRFPVYRITALDPAGVTYTKDTPKEKRLDSSDAYIVDVIHTNGGRGLPYLGIYSSLGDVDFYVNGGVNQPRCTGSVWKALKTFNILYVIGVSSVPSLCAHEKSLEYYKMSINNSPEKLIAYACSSYKEFKSGNCTGNDATKVPMGYDFDKFNIPEQRKKKVPRKYYIDIEEF